MRRWKNKLFENLFFRNLSIDQRIMIMEYRSIEGTVNLWLSSERRRISISKRVSRALVLLLPTLQSTFYFVSLRLIDGSCSKKKTDRTDFKYAGKNAELSRRNVIDYFFTSWHLTFIITFKARTCCRSFALFYANSIVRWNWKRRRLKSRNLTVCFKLTWF